MYGRILVALENSATDRTLIEHIIALAKIHASRLLLVHVADGWVARNFDALKLADSQEMKHDRAYLDQVAAEMRASGLPAESLLALGEPAKEIVKVAEREKCDLIALCAHGHRALGDFIYGSTISEVHHSTSVPILLVRAQEPAGAR